MWRELCLGARALRRSPGFAGLAVVVLALAIGASSAAVSVADAVLFDPLPYGDADRLYSVYERNPDGAIRQPSAPTVRDWSESRATFDGLSWVRGDVLGVTSDHGTMLLLAAYSGADLFATLGVAPVLGRLFDQAEAVSGAPVAVIGWHTWRTEFGGDPDIIGRTLSTGNGPLEVIGVLASGVRYPAWAHMWVPVGVLTGDARAVLERRDLHVDAQTVVRLKPDATPEMAARELGAISERLAALHADLIGWTGAELRDIRSEFLGAAPSRVLVLGGAAGLLLLIGCVNVAGLFLARSVARGGERAVRAALGATPGWIAAPLAAEASLIAIGAAVLALPIALVLLRGLGAVASDALPRIAGATIAAGPLSAAIVAGALTALVFAFLPARRAAHAQPADALRSSRGGGGRAEERLRAGLVVAEIALAVVLVTGAVALVQALTRLTTIDVGVDLEPVVVVRVEPPRPRYASAAAAAALYADLEAAVRAVPGVSRAAQINHLPLSGTSMPTPVVSGRPTGDGERPQAFFRTMSAAYVETVGVAVTRGRTFTEGEVAGAAAVAVVNEALARQEWPGEDPIGRTLRITKVAQTRPDFGEEVVVRVVGVIADTRTFGPAQPAPPAVYVPVTLTTWPSIFIVARGEQDAAALIQPIRRALLAVDETLPIAGPGFANQVRRYADYADNWIRAERAAATLWTAFALAAFLLAMVGLFGVIAYVVAQREREIGVRLAIGAAPRGIVRLIVLQSARLAVLGIAAGVAAALVLGTSARALGEVVPRPEPLAIALAGAVFLVGAVLAAGLPAARAARVEPIAALRTD